MNFKNVAQLGKADLDAPVFYDMDRMNVSLASGEIRVPKGLSREARRQFVRENRANAHRG